MTLADTTGGNWTMAMIHTAIEWAALLIESMAVAVAMYSVGRVAATHEAVRRLFPRSPSKANEQARLQLDRDLLLCLSLLVAADIVRTVTLPLTMVNMAMLGALVLIRTTLSWSLSVEIDGCWPWQARALAGAASRERPGTE